MDRISYIIPCYCSVHTISQVVEEIQEEMKSVLSHYDYEIILINDSSPDTTMETITELANQYEKVMGINLSKNFGQHAALMAGLRQASGDLMVCLDDDGQTPANEVHRLIQAIEAGYDVVYARYGQKKHSLFRNFGSRMNELMARALLDKPKDLYISSYFVAKRYVIDHVIQYENSYPYVIGLVLRTTKKIGNVDVLHRERTCGESGYTLHKLLSLWINGFTAFSIKPLRLATLSGFICAMVGFGYGVYTVVKKFVNPLVPMGFSSTMAALMFIGGMLMLMLGLIGEYIGRIYISLNNAPQYVIRERVGDNKRLDDEQKD
ncbi:MAG: glycosyltransferase family 2 protein [Eubacteriales bacterium]